ncbi:hypothetical protein SAMN05421541_103252 [Actinoplanes philippinensis]|uniref:Uncharacterized protein n=1 Tax=Actinoplanes philippinensis TaxID=35752 RepID=A0A1I2CY93_9ACTN|nr:hypothetical protein SAMN05421541_103252 [Actinoplanes philippinensis]
MGQASLFSRSEISAMRDRTRSRNYSAARDEFRREHERHREWGLRQRHGEKLRRLRQSRAAPEAAETQKGPSPSPLSPPSRASLPAPLSPPSRASLPALLSAPSTASSPPPQSAPLRASLPALLSAPSATSSHAPLSAPPTTPSSAPLSALSHGPSVAPLSASSHGPSVAPLSASSHGPSVAPLGAPPVASSPGPVAASCRALSASPQSALELSSSVSAVTVRVTGPAEAAVDQTPEITSGRSSSRVRSACVAFARSPCVRGGFSARRGIFMNLCGPCRVGAEVSLIVSVVGQVRLGRPALVGVYCCSMGFVVRVLVVRARFFFVLLRISSSVLALRWVRCPRGLCLLRGSHLRPGLRLGCDAVGCWCLLRSHERNISGPSTYSGFGGRYRAFEKLTTRRGQRVGDTESDSRSRARDAFFCGVPGGDGMLRIGDLGRVRAGYRVVDTKADRALELPQEVGGALVQIRPNAEGNLLESAGVRCTCWHALGPVERAGCRPRLLGRRRGRLPASVVGRACSARAVVGCACLACAGAGCTRRLSAAHARPAPLSAAHAWHAPGLAARTGCRSRMLGTRRGPLHASEIGRTCWHAPRGRAARAGDRLHLLGPGRASSCHVERAGDSAYRDAALRKDLRRAGPSPGRGPSRNAGRQVTVRRAGPCRSRPRRCR